MYQVGAKVGKPLNELRIKSQGAGLAGYEIYQQQFIKRWVAKTFEKQKVFNEDDNMSD